MSTLNPLLKMFMKPDKKEIPEATEEKKEIQKQNEKNDNKGNKEQIIDQNPSAQKNKKTKNDKGKSQSKKKKVLLDQLPDFQINEMDSHRATKIPDFKHLSPKDDVFLLDHFKANSEWEDSLFSWFARLRPRIHNMTSGDAIPLKSVIALIQKGEMPKSNEACNVQDVEQILFYFERQTTNFTKSDLAWIFSALIFTDRLLNNEVAQCLSNVLTKMIVQINSLQTKEDPLYSYLMIDTTLLQGFFHLSS